MNKRPRRKPAADKDRLMFSLISTGHAVEGRLEQALAEVGLSLAKFDALTHLVESGDPIRLGECAEKMTCVRSNITQLVDRLEADGLVRRVEDPRDRRSVRAELTPLGKERQAAGAKAMAKVQAELARTLAGIDHGKLKRVLAALA